MISNKELKDIAFQTLSPYIEIELINIAEVWHKTKHYKELSVWKETENIIGDLILSIEIDDDYNLDEVKNLILWGSKIDYRGEYFLNQNK